MGQGQGHGRPTVVSRRRRAEHCRPAVRSLWGFQATESALQWVQHSSSLSCPAKLLSLPRPQQKGFSLTPAQQSRRTAMSATQTPSPNQPSLQSPSHPCLSPLPLDGDCSMDQGYEWWDSGSGSCRHLWIPSRRRLCVCDSRALPPQAACGAEGAAWVWPWLSPAHPQAHIPLTSTCSHSP